MYIINDINGGNGQLDFQLLPSNISIRVNFVRICGRLGGTGGQVDWIGILDKEMETTPLTHKRLLKNPCKQGVNMLLMFHE